MIGMLYKLDEKMNQERQEWEEERIYTMDTRQEKGGYESYFGGKRKGKRGRGAEGKIPVFGILERDEEGVKVELSKELKNSQKVDYEDLEK